jgi:transposase
MSHGKKVPRERRAFSAEFKLQAVQLVQERRAVGVPLMQIGSELDVQPGILRRWIEQLAKEETPGAPARGGLASESEAVELRRLRRENAVLRQEREFLKKATAFFARESR